MQAWEYKTLFIQAEAEREMAYLVELYSFKDGIPRNTPEAMIPELNALGSQGWELVHMQPVFVGRNADVIMTGDNTNRWTSTYFCVFKRPAAG